MRDVKEVLHHFVVHDLMSEEVPRIDDGDDLTDVLDSLSMLQLVDFIEREFQVQIPDEEIVPENFLSLEQLDRYVRSKLA